MGAFEQPELSKNAEGWPDGGEFTVLPEIPAGWEVPFNGAASKETKDCGGSWAAGILRSLPTGLYDSVNRKVFTIPEISTV